MAVMVSAVSSVTGQEDRQLPHGRDRCDRQRVGERAAVGDDRQPVGCPDLPGEQVGRGGAGVPAHPADGQTGSGQGILDGHRDRRGTTQQDDLVHAQAFELRHDAVGQRSAVGEQERGVKLAGDGCRRQRVGEAAG